MLRFPGEGGCVEMFEHRRYFGDLLCVFELTAMTAVNLKVDRKEDCKDSPRAEEETVAFLDHSGSEEEFDPSTLPDPDKFKDSDAEQDSESEDSYSELEEKTGRKKRSYSNSATAEEMPLKRKKMHFSQEEDPCLPLDTGLSLAEDEELVLHLLNSHN
ncbi:hypothetical protein EK904_004540 [Melospiza melodia maxima]|nr:hypothetical protein EK904_004540 [Melospiza melodia maxima]